MRKIVLLSCVLSLAYSAQALATTATSQNTALNSDTTQAVAAQPADTSVASENSDNGDANAKDAPSDATPANPHDKSAPSIAEIAAPSDSVLSKANAELLVKNAELERQVNDLTTQVNVLTHERSGQLFLYGALTVLFTIGLCVLVAALISMRGQRSRW